MSNIKSSKQNIPHRKIVKKSFKKFILKKIVHKKIIQEKYHTLFDTEEAFCVKIFKKKLKLILFVKKVVMQKLV